MLTKSVDRKKPCQMLNDRAMLEEKNYYSQYFALSDGDSNQHKFMDFFLYQMSNHNKSLIHTRKHIRNF